MLIHQQRVADILTDHTLVCVLRNVTQVVDEVDSLSLRALTWFIDPEVVLATGQVVSLLLGLFYPGLDLSKPGKERLVVFWVVVGLRHEVKGRHTKLLLHVQDVLGKPILAS